MRLIVAAILLLPAANFGQAILDPAKTALAGKYFDAQKSDKPVHCEVIPFRPQLNFSFRFQSGYVMRVPMSQYSGKGHGWGILTRVTPEAGGSPVYLGSTITLPDIPKTKVFLEMGGGFLVGEGRYRVEWIMFDDTNRICRKNWHIEAKLSSSERDLKLGIEPNTVSQVSFRRWSPKESGDADVHTLRRLTVLLHAAPLFPNSTKLRAQDRIMLLGSLASLLESLPARSVRLTVFNLDQQKELFHQDVFTADGFNQVAQSMNNLELQLVDYKILQNRLGHVDLLADMVNQERRSEEASDAVIFLGPAARFSDKVPASALEDRTSGPPFFYLQYRPYLSINTRLRRGGDFPDSIEFALKKLRGKTIVVHTPDEFAKAIKQVDAQVAGK